MPKPTTFSFAVGNFGAFAASLAVQTRRVASIFGNRDLEGTHISLAPESDGQWGTRAQRLFLECASSVGLVYLERDHAHFREVKAVAKRLKDEFGVKRVGMMSYVHEGHEGHAHLVGQKTGFRLLLQGRLELVWLACQGI